MHYIEYTSARAYCQIGRDQYYGRMKGHIFFISGPSGVGKGTVIDHLRTAFPSFIFPPSGTTRAPRPGEIDGETYYFLDDKTFDQMIDEGAFLEYATVHGGARYGTIKAKLMDAVNAGKTVIREFDVQGYLQARERLPRELFTSIFLHPADAPDVIAERIRDRAPISEEELEKRLESMQNETANAQEYDYTVMSYHGEQERLINDVVAIITGDL